MPLILRVDPIERLHAPESSGRLAERGRAAILFAGFLLIHIGVLGLFFATGGLEEPLTPEQEISVEVVPPPEQQAQPEPPPEEQPKEKEKEKEQPKPQPSLDLKPAFDAPRTQNEEKVEREAPDKTTASPRVAPQTEQTAAAQAPANTTEQAKVTPAPTQGPASERTALSRPDAEAIERAEPKPDNAQPSSSPQQTAQPNAGTPLFLQQLASLKPIPDYKFSGAARPAPVSGGTAQNNYLSILYGMIMPHMRVPPTVRTQVRGAVVIMIDTNGNILHSGVVQPSGSVELDNAALAAVRRGSPFPPPPKGLPAVRFSYGAPL